MEDLVKAVGASRESGGIRQCATWTERMCAKERLRESGGSRQCGGMNEGSMLKEVLKEVRILKIDESPPLYFVRFGSWE